jgi:hypothetical protein
MDPDIDFREFMGAFDTVLVGRRTCEATRHLGGAGMPGMQAFVFSRTIRQADCPDVIVSDKPAETLATLKARRREDIWVFSDGVAGATESRVCRSVSRASSANKRRPLVFCIACRRASP